MKRVSATLTSKWQITLPKLVRDVMDMSTGDQLDFVVHNDGIINVEKKKTDEKSESVYNLVNLLLANKLPLAIKGWAGVGKTKFVSDFILKHYSDNAVAVIEPYKELYINLDERVDRLIYLGDFSLMTEELAEQLTSRLIENKVSLLVIEEAQLLRGNYSIIGKALKEDIKVIVIQQSFSEEELQCLGEHYVVLADKRQLANVGKIEIVKPVDSESYFMYQPLYRI